MRWDVPACDGAIEFADDGADLVVQRAAFVAPSPTCVLQDGDFVTAKRRLPVKLELPGRFNQANAVMAAATAEVHGVDAQDALAAMAGVGEVEGRFSVVTLGAVTTRLLLAKNPAGWTELLGMLDDNPEPVVIGINARIADGHDPSWLWDVPFERLAGRTVVATGERCRDLAVRLHYAGVAHITVEDQMDALAAAAAARLEYVGNYTAFQDLRRRLARVTALPATSGVSGVPTMALHSDALHSEVGAAAAPPRARSGEVTTVARRRRSPSKPSTLRVVVVHPDLLGTYGDGGNGEILVRRAQWRDIGAELVLAHSDSPLPTSADVYCIGGGEDGPQVQSARLLASGSLAAAVSGGAVVLAVCAGYQIVGGVFAGPDGGSHEGLGLLDVSTEKGTGPRAVGEVVADVVTTPGAARRETLTGFENHSGVTRLGPGTTPLAVVRMGVGNGDGAGTEGACSGSVIGTYLHGPVLARNPWLADRLLALATGGALEPLDDTEEARASSRAPVGWHGPLVAPTPDTSGPPSPRIGASPMNHPRRVRRCGCQGDVQRSRTLARGSRRFDRAGEWDQPGLGEWNVRELVGHASRALVTAKEYLLVPGEGDDAAPDDADTYDAVDGASRYFLGTHDNPTLHAQVAERGRQAADELGGSPAVGLGELATGVIGLIEAAPAGSVFATRFGTLGFATYLHTRTVEMVVHGLDVSGACDLSVELPDDASRLTLEVMAGVARHRGEGDAVIATLGGRSVLPAGFNVFG